jgi:hypothetical protein
MRIIIISAFVGYIINIAIVLFSSNPTLKDSCLMCVNKL